MRTLRILKHNQLQTGNYTRRIRARMPKLIAGAHKDAVVIGKCCPMHILMVPRHTPEDRSNA